MGHTEKAGLSTAPESTAAGATETPDAAGASQQNRKPRFPAFHHLRFTGRPDDSTDKCINSRGGVTVMVNRLPSTDSRLALGMTAAVCSPVDNFQRETGRFKATRRFTGLEIRYKLGKPPIAPSKVVVMPPDTTEDELREIVLEFGAEAARNCWGRGWGRHVKQMKDAGIPVSKVDDLDWALEMK